MVVGGNRDWFTTYRTLRISLQTSMTTLLLKSESKSVIPFKQMSRNEITEKRNIGYIYLNGGALHRSHC